MQGGRREARQAVASAGWATGRGASGQSMQGRRPARASGQRGQPGSRRRWATARAGCRYKRAGDGAGGQRRQAARGGMAAQAAVAAQGGHDGTRR